MNDKISTLETKVGVLGGGQLGKMMAIAGAKWHIPLYFLDQDSNFPVGPYTNHFVVGDFKNEADVYEFGRKVDVITVEIENVNLNALEKLEKEGKKVFPQPRVLRVIKDKGLQKEFYAKHNFPTSPFTLFDSSEAIRQALSEGSITLPFVQKIRTGGYDGKGVLVVRNQTDLSDLMEGPSVVEDCVDIVKEIAVVAAANPDGEIKVYEPVEMVFHPTANLVEFLKCPASLDETQNKIAKRIAADLIRAFGVYGLLAVELFLDTQGNILVNEVAPRTHNSGHHTIDSCETSQFEQHLRAVLNWPLGDTRLLRPAVMINLLGAPHQQGAPYYENLEDALGMEGANVHIYGKSMVKPFRKMGHITITDPTIEGAVMKAKFLEDTIRVLARTEAKN